MKKILHSFIVSFCFFVVAHMALASDYATERANSSPALDIINADTAYQLGYTGQGVTLGVIDTLARADHPDFANKMTIYVHSDWGRVYWELDGHGSHVAGIMAAARNGIGMHGVAYDANLHNTNYLHDYYSDTGEVKSYNLLFSIADFFASSPDMRIVNNSWGGLFYPVAVQGGQVVDIKLQSPIDPSITYSVYDIIDDHTFLSQYLAYTQENPEIVTVFAGGNDGKISSTLEGLLPRYYGLNLANWLNVGSINSYNITKNMDGSLNLSPLSISTFSNLAAGAERWTVYAPGSYILSVDARNDGFYDDSGTSMAAPVVSGALGLVQQAYPWMNGKQLVDAILTTANTNFTTPQFTLGLTFNTDPSKQKLTFYSIDGGLGDSLTQEEAEDLLTDAYSLVDPKTVDDPLALSISLVDRNQYEVLQLTRDQAFGRGILDVGKAVQGIALLDINRLTQDHALSIPELGGNIYAMEAFDTKGYFATFSNDISEEKWNNDYHHADFRTTGTYNENALALDGLGAGIIKQGLGTLMLRGHNSYTGPTVIEDGVLGLMPRPDGSGGVLSQSDVIVRTAGTFYSSHGVVSKSVQNSGVVYIAHGFEAGSAFSQTSEGLLQLEITDEVPKSFITTPRASLAGDLQFVLEEDFYHSVTQLQFDVFDSPSISGAFNTANLWEDSPTLSGTSKAFGSSYQVSLARPSNAYTQYATNNAERAVGNALFALVPHAEGDMQTLISALDFSNPSGSDVQQGLNALGTQTQHQLAQASLKQQGSYNSLLIHRLLQSTQSPKLEIQEKQSGIPTGSSLNEYAQTPWEVWGSVMGSGTGQGEYDGYDGWKSSGVGMLIGADYTWQEGVKTGFHVGFSTRRTHAQGDLDSVTDTQSFSLGVHGIVSPASWDNWYVMAQGRIGSENNSQTRTVAFANYMRTHTSEWADFVGSALIGGGKSWHMENFSAGPVFWLEYSFLQRPEISESGYGASTLHMDSITYDSLRTGVGLQMEYSTHLSENFSLDMNGLIAWRHELLDGTLYTQAAFKGYEAVPFTTETPLMGRNSFFAQASMRFNHVDNYFLELNIGAELSDANAHSFNAGFQAGYSF